MKKLLFRTILLSGLFLLILTAPAGAAFDRTLTYGSEGPAVSELQAFLSRQGVYAGPTNGKFGPLTMRGVRAFQTREAISPANGSFGPKTRARADALLARTGQANLAERIRALLAQLTELQSRLPASSTAAISAENPSIDPGAIVGINCYFKYLPTGQVFNLGKGSGAIVRSDGLVLTARHLVDLKFSYEVDPGSTSAAIAANSTLDHCDVGQVPPGSVLPAPELIRSVNPSTQVPVLAYRAALSFLPADIAESTAEKQAVDFALLQIQGISEAGKQFGAAMPTSFPAVPLLTANVLRGGDEILTYGFPGDITEARQGSFTTFFLVGGVGRVKSVLFGNDAYRDIPVTINTDMEVRPGRSGSPLFYQGKLAGVISAHSLENVTDSFSVSSQAILAVLRRAGISL